MTLEELKAKYQELVDTCNKRGDEYHKQAQELESKGQTEDANRYYNKANFEYYNALMYITFVGSLRRIEQ